MNDWKILIHNTDTGREKWYACPLDKDAIFNDLDIYNEHYIISEYETPCSLPFCKTIEDVIDEYDAYLMLPEELQNNIGDIMDSFDSTKDVLEYYNDGSLHFYPEYKTVYDYLRQSIEESGNVSKDMLDYIDYDKYLDDFEVNNFIIETGDGLVVVELWWPHHNK